jgi:DNA-binding NarL/FixJ family response regulator
MSQMPTELIMKKNSTISILIVDDNEMVRRSLRLFLELHDDFKLIGEAVNGQEAVMICSGLSPDIILMDIKMPVMDGIEATRLIRAQNPSMCILALTSLNDNSKVEEIMSAGANAHLLKQASIDQIDDAIRHLCDFQENSLRESTG